MRDRGKGGRKGRRKGGRKKEEKRNIGVCVCTHSALFFERV